MCVCCVFCVVSRRRVCACGVGVYLCVVVVRLLLLLMMMWLLLLCVSAIVVVWFVCLVCSCVSFRRAAVVVRLS